MKLALVLMGAACLVQAAEAASRQEREVGRVLRLKADPESGERRYLASCAACHGVDGAGGNEGLVPRLAGQRFAVLVDQLVGFRFARRTDGGMQARAGEHRLDAQGLADVAGYVSQLSSPASVRGPGLMLGAGAQLFADRCSECHGASGEGTDTPPVPRVATQNFGYLLQQLEGFRNGRRPDARREHATRLERLEPDSVAAIADHLSRQ